MFWVDNIISKIIIYDTLYIQKVEIRNSFEIFYIINFKLK